jgi:hypothetical protein
MVFGRWRITKDAEHSGPAYETANLICSRDADRASACQAVGRGSFTLRANFRLRSSWACGYQYYGFVAALRAASKRRM